MANFKVICKKSDQTSWVQTPIGTKVVTTKRLFGLITKTSIEQDKKFMPGPRYDEVCIVHDHHTTGGVLYYDLLGYPYGGYDAKHFIRLDEFTETAAGLAKRSVPQLN